MGTSQITQISVTLHLTQPNLVAAFAAWSAVTVWQSRQLKNRRSHHRRIGSSESSIVIYCHLLWTFNLSTSFNHYRIKGGVRDLPLEKKRRFRLIPPHPAAHRQRTPFGARRRPCCPIECRTFGESVDHMWSGQ